MDFRRMECRLDFAKIFGCLALNLIAAGGVFASTYLVTRSATAAIFYTFVSWSMTISLSTGYWVFYLYKNVKAKSEIKRSIALLLVIMLATALVLVWWVVNVLGV